MDTQESLVLVGHSGAGALLPLIGAALEERIIGYVFVDALLPPPSGDLSADEPFLLHLQTLAIEGRLPPWSQWWGDDTMRSLVPDASMRRQIESELPELPLAYFEESIPVPDAWERVPAGYIHFSGVYEVASQEAAQRGFAVEYVPGGHLHLVVEPKAVAERIVGVAARLGTK